MLTQVSFESYLFCVDSITYIMLCKSSGSLAATSSASVTVSNEAFVLTLSGKCLDVSTLVNKKKKFRFRGGKDGALKTMKELEESGLGTLLINKSKGSVKVWI